MDTNEEIHIAVDPASGDDFTIDWPEERADIIGQNGNDGDHYANDVGIDSDNNNSLPSVGDIEEGC